MLDAFKNYFSDSSILDPDILAPCTQRIFSGWSSQKQEEYRTLYKRFERVSKDIERLKHTASKSRRLARRATDNRNRGRMLFPSKRFEDGIIRD